MPRIFRIAWAFIVFAAAPAFATEPPDVNELVVGERYEVRIGEAELERRLSGTLLLRNDEWLVLEDRPSVQQSSDFQYFQYWISATQAHVFSRLEPLPKIAASAPKDFGDCIVVALWKEKAKVRASAGRVVAWNRERTTIDFDQMNPGGTLEVVAAKVEAGDDADKVGAPDAKRTALESDAMIVEVSRTPWLSDLPGIGSWFTRTRVRAERARQQIPRSDLLCLMVPVRAGVASAHPGARQGLQ